jgi:F420-non-reducing hydrogenase iron-sulfur subunit
MSERFEPRIVAFLCRWCAYTGADLAGISRIKYPPNAVPIRVSCSSRVNPGFVLRALGQGADGVLIAGCHPGDCHYRVGNYHARRRMALLKQVLTTLGLEPERVQLTWVAASEGRRFADVIGEFTEKLRALGPQHVWT